MLNGVIMFINNRGFALRLQLGRWRQILCAALVLGLAAVAGADPVKIEFLPPPMEGTISLGIYDASGKLVRVLHREADASELTAGENGFIAQWDGRDETGTTCPPGSYRARGVMVGDLAVEGVDFSGNDWITRDDSPHLKRITALGMTESGAPVIAATVAGQAAPGFFSIVFKPGASLGDEAEPELIAQPGLPAPALSVHDGQIVGASVPGLKKPVTDAAPGIKGTVWVIEGNALKQYSKKGKPLATVAAEPGDPPMSKIAASPTEEKVYVLYENAQLQRMRGYDFTGLAPGAEPKELFENDIWASDRYEQIASRLKFPDEKPFVASPVLTVALIPNPLANNKLGSLQIKAGVDKEGAYLATTDGLPLCHVSETKGLSWAMMGQPAGSKTLTVFDSDGAAVEQFSVTKAANMMAFDAGAVTWPEATPTPAVATPTPSPAPSPAETPAAPAATPASSSPSPSPAPSVPAAISRS